MEKIKLGQLVKIVDNTTAHHFEIGEIVKFTDIKNHGFDSTDGLNRRWFLSPEDYETLEKKEDYKNN